MIENLITAEEREHLIVGFKQVLKAKNNGSCSKIFLAMDASSSIIDALSQNSNGISVVEVPTMRELGNACEIDVSASCAAIIRL